MNRRSLDEIQFIFVTFIIGVSFFQISGMSSGNQGEIIRGQIIV